MASTLTPKILGPDGILREEIVFSTTLGSRFFTGTAGSNTVDIEVSIRGGAFSSDPDFVTFDGTNWTLPNPAVFPDGLDLLTGVNEVLIRAVSTSGSVSSPAIATVRLVRAGDLGVVATIPSNVSVEQLDDSVRIDVEGVSDAAFQGVNFYASVSEGGGATGYIRLNVQTVTSSTTTEEVSDVGSFEAEAPVPLNPDLTPVADPLYVSYTGRQVDKDGNVVQDDFTEQIVVPESARQLRTTISLQAVRTIQVYAFEHSRSATTTSTPSTVFVGAFASLAPTDPLYYVVAGIYYDPTTMLEFESPFSAEVVAHPLRVSVTVGTFPVVSRQQIVRDTITSIFRSNPQIKVEPGAVLRDTFIDPFAAEAERVRFILDFLHRAQSFAGLLGVDDPTNSGTSVSVGSSTYKQALKKSFGLSSDADTQSVIDRAFEALASNYGIFRLPGRYARGEVTFFTTKRPTSSVLVPLGTSVSGGSINFRVTRGTSIPLDNQARFYDPVSGRYRVTVSVQATAVGSAGNVGAGQVRRVVAGVTGLSVINNGNMFGGDDQETNRELSVRARNALASVDSGTKRGYLQTAADVPGVVRANVVAAGDRLMQRDLDSAGIHRGGKVDVWVQGENLSTVTDPFAFAFSVGTNIQFLVVGDPSDYIFRAIDPLLTQALPIIEMLDDSAAGFLFRNATTGGVFDLTDVTIVSYDTVQLSTAVVQPAVTLSDVVLGDYRRRSGNTFTMTRQPVRAVVSVVGATSGTLPTSAWALVHAADPLNEGRSELAGDFVQITPVDDGAGGFVPAGGTVAVTDEAHTLVAEYPEYLNNLGVNTLTLVVTNEDGSITYRGPDDPSGISDYTVIVGDETTAAAIKRIPTGDILSGQTVLVDYEHDENFVVTYTTNVIVSVTQEAIDADKHATADVVVKEAVEVPVDLSATVTLRAGVDQTTADTAIRTNLSNLFAGLTLGTAVRQSDIVAVIEGTTGVSFLDVPLTKLVRAEGAVVVREALSSGQAGDNTYVSAWSTPSVSVWLIEQELTAATTDGGGSTDDFRGVFQDDAALQIVLTSPATSLGAAAGRTFIIGSTGYSITGFSDDATLIAGGYVTPDAIAAQRALLTANRILVSTVVDDSPVKHNYTATYIVGVDSGAKNIVPGAVEVLVVGDIEFTFDEEH